MNNSRKAGRLVVYRVVTRLAVAASWIFGPEGAYQSQIAIASSTNRPGTTTGTEEYGTKRRPLAGGQPVYKRFDMRADANRTIPWANPAPGADPVERLPPTFFSCREPCLIRKRVSPASWPSKSCKQDSRGKGGVFDVGVEHPSAPRALVAFLVEPRSVLHARGRTRET
jgi:hypothetical protein